MDQITLKTEREIALMAKSGRKLAQIRELLVKKAKPGVRTITLDRLAEKEILAFGGLPSFKTVRGYRFTTCISINDEVVHGLPSERQIKFGDVVGIDLGMIYQGWHTDTAWTVLVGDRGSVTSDQREKQVKNFLKVGEETLGKAIKEVKLGKRIGHISQIIESNIKQAGYSPVKILTGHGVGKVLHEDPPIPQFLDSDVRQTPEIIPGMTLAIEVIYNLGTAEVAQKNDGWTIVTADGKISATFEKTIAVSDSGVLVLTP